MFDATAGRFRIGTLSDGATPRDDGSGLDTQLWPVLAFDRYPVEWRRAIAWAERNHGVAGGFDFNDDRDGIWNEGTAQAALAYRAIGDDARAASLLAVVARSRAADGMLFATDGGTVSTGLGFEYRHRTHLGATAWAAIAASGWNPFTGRRHANNLEARQ